MSAPAQIVRYQQFAGYNLHITIFSDHVFK